MDYSLRVMIILAVICINLSFADLGIPPGDREKNLSHKRVQHGKIHRKTSMDRN